MKLQRKKNEGVVYFNLYGDMETLKQKPKFKIGDMVRISKYKRKVFDKGYTPNWSEEVFRIDKIIRRDYKKKQALVSWKGYSDDFNSWIPIKDLKKV